MGKGRSPCCDKIGLKKGPWTPAEDQKLISFIQKHGHSNWRALPKQAGLLRCGKSCRLRWINYLRPDIKRGNFTLDEEETIMRLHESLGNKWSFIASHLPGRTDNEIKNVWNTHLKKRLPSKATNPCKDKPTESSICSSSSSSSSSSSTSNISKISKSPSEEPCRVLCDTKLENFEKIVSAQSFINNCRHSDGRASNGYKNGLVMELSNWVVEGKSNPLHEDAREATSPSYSSGSSYVSHPKQVVEGTKPEEVAPHEQLIKKDKPFEVHDTTTKVLNKDPFGELFEGIPFEPDFLDMFDTEPCFMSFSMEPLTGTETHQELVSSGEESKKEVESRNWVTYLENELGLQEKSEDDHEIQNSVQARNAFGPQGTSLSIDDEMMMKTATDPVSMYFQTWPPSPLDYSFMNQKH